MIETKEREKKRQVPLEDNGANDFLYFSEALSAKRIWVKETLKALFVSSAMAFLVFILAWALWGIIGIAGVIGTCGMVFYTMVIGFRFFLMLFSLKDARESRAFINQKELAALRWEDLPLYTILCPLYREDRAVLGLARSLSALRYPKDKLDVRLIVEQGDRVTLAALAVVALPPFIRVETVPDATIVRSKPRALNAVLPRCADEGFLTIYDAEDRPEQNQLLVAYLTFQKSSPEVVCLQAKIRHYNWNQNILTRWFSAEYGVWYEYVLPALGFLKLPIPLGGNSNHFRVDFLKEGGGWDPYNVTEDANLGIQIARRGGKMRILQSPTEMINSTTLEEATPFLGGWIRQRSRWIKGYLQTFLVHIRSPRALYRDLGFWGTITFLFLLAGTPFTHILNVLFAGLAVMWFAFKPEWINWFFPGPVTALHIVTLLIGNCMFIAMHVIASLREGKKSVALASLFIPLYWALMAVATVKSVWQLLFRPHYWEKTHHNGEESKG